MKIKSNQIKKKNKTSTHFKHEVERGREEGVLRIPTAVLALKVVSG